MYDIIIFNWLYGLWQENKLAASFVRFSAVYLPWFAALSVFGWYVYKKNRAVLFMLAATAFFSLATVEALKRIIGRTRPYILFNHITPLISPGGNLAMPSAHALVLSSLAAFVFFKNRRFGLVLYLAVFLISAARVSAGVHWPSDILAGVIVGSLIGWVAHIAEKKIFLLKSLSPQ